MPRRPLAALAVLLLAGTSACVVDQNADNWPCTTDEECLDEQFCVEGVCSDERIPVCNDADGDMAFAGPDCASAPEAQDCDDANRDRFPGASETCNGVDDDCDEAIDEDIAATACPLTEGVCAGAMTTCVDGMPAACDYGTDFAETEAGTLCTDGLDNDCDGDADQDDTDCPRCIEGQPCAMGNGCLPPTTPDQCACKSGGTTVCEGTTEVCVDANGDPISFPGGTETCGNGIDDNCLSGVDEGCE